MCPYLSKPNVSVPFFEIYPSYEYISYEYSSISYSYNQHKHLEQQQFNLTDNFMQHFFNDVCMQECKDVCMQECKIMKGSSLSPSTVTLC